MPAARAAARRALRRGAGSGSRYIRVVLYRADPWLHVIAGCMFSGKTDELLRLLRRAEIAGRRIILVRPTGDDRTAPGVVESRSGVAFRARAVSDSGEIPGIVSTERASVVAIDEAQFFDA